MTSNRNGKETSMQSLDLAPEASMDHVLTVIANPSSTSSEIRTGIYQPQHTRATAR